MALPPPAYYPTIGRNNNNTTKLYPPGWLAALKLMRCLQNLS